MRIEYLADHPDRLETLARWHHEEWHHLNPGDTVENRRARMRAHLAKRQIPTTFVALDGGTLLIERLDPPGGLLATIILKLFAERQTRKAIPEGLAKIKEKLEAS